MSTTQTTSTTINTIEQVAAEIARPGARVEIEMDCFDHITIFAADIDIDTVEIDADFDEITIMWDGERRFIQF